MVGNLLETGTLFDYMDVDFRRLLDRQDSQLANDPTLIVGEQNIPDRDNRYIEKTFEDED